MLLEAELGSSGDRGAQVRGRRDLDQPKKQTGNHHDDDQYDNDDNGDNDDDDDDDDDDEYEGGEIWINPKNKRVIMMMIIMISMIIRVTKTPSACQQC